MRNTTAYLVGVLIAGCGAGVSSDPTGSGTSPLEAEPTQLLANVLATQAITSDAANDATYVAIVEDPDVHDARLIRQDLRTAEITELDRMPIGKGTAQILLSEDGVIWGFGGNGSEAVTFRNVGNSGATAIPIADQGPVSLLAQSFSHRLYYASENDCAIEPLNLTTGQIDAQFRTSFSCYMTIDSVVQTNGVAIIRATDDPGHSIRGYFKSQNIFSLVDQSDSDLVGPFPSTVEEAAGGAAPQYPGWVRTDGDGKSHIMTVPTNPWSLLPNPGTELQVIDDPIAAGAVVHREFWGATLGDPTILFHVAKDGVRQHTVSYQPRAMFPLHNRLVVLTTDGTLLDQPISADD